MFAGSLPIGLQPPRVDYPYWPLVLFAIGQLLRDSRELITNNYSAALTQAADYLQDPSTLTDPLSRTTAETVRQHSRALHAYAALSIEVARVLGCLWAAQDNSAMALISNAPAVL